MDKIINDISLLLASKKKKKNSKHKKKSVISLLCDIATLHCHIRDCILIDYNIIWDEVVMVVDYLGLQSEIDVIVLSGALFLMNPKYLYERLCADIKSNFDKLSFVDCKEGQDTPMLLNESNSRYMEITNLLHKFYQWWDEYGHVPQPNAVKSFEMTYQNDLIPLAGWLLGYLSIYCVANADTGNGLSLQPLLLVQIELNLEVDRITQMPNELCSVFLLRDNDNPTVLDRKLLCKAISETKKEEASRSIPLCAFSIPVDIITENDEATFTARVQLLCQAIYARQSDARIIANVTAFSSIVCNPRVGL